MKKPSLVSVMLRWALPGIWRRSRHGTSYPFDNQPGSMGYVYILQPSIARYIDGTLRVLTMKIWPMDLDSCDNIINHALSSRNETEFCLRINPLIGGYRILSVGLERANIFWRARLTEKAKWPAVSDMRYPPTGKAGQGRLNEFGRPCFYAARDIQTALLEVHAKEGQLIQVAGYRVRCEEILRLIIVGEYAHVQRHGYMRFSGTDPDNTIQKLLNQDPAARAKLYIDQFFASVLGDVNASQAGYMFSRALGAMLHSKVTADGILFTSVLDSGGLNLAITPTAYDRAIHNVACLLIKVGKQRKFGVLDYEIIESASDIDADKNFVWPSEYHAGRYNVYGMTKQEFDAASAGSR